MNAQRHEMTKECASVHCFWHEIDESTENGFYILCGECGHVYLTARELRRAFRREFWECTGRWSKPFGHRGWWPSLPSRLWRLATIRAKDIYFCQECIHDF